jgi:hypothetical protein
MNLSSKLYFINEESNHRLKQFSVLSNEVFVSLQFYNIQINIRSNQIALTFPYYLMRSKLRILAYPYIRAVRAP